MSDSKEFRNFWKRKQPFGVRMMPLLFILTLLIILQTIQVIYSILTPPFSPILLTLSLAGLGFAVIVMLLLVVSLRRHKDD